MNKSINNAILAAVVLVGSLLASCNKPKDSVPAPEPMPNAIGSFNFDQKEFPLVSAAYSSDENYIYFMFASQDIKTEKVSCYFNLALKKEYVGAGKVDVSTLGHNFEYVFEFETPAVYYSRFKKVTGNLEIKENSEGNYTVDLNLVLIDGKPFKFSYTGAISKLT